MDIHSFYENIKSQAEAINVNLNNEMCEQFYYYMKLMLEWNENINLTAIIEEDEIILKHFVDSLTINKYIQTKNYSKQLKKNYLQNQKLVLQIQKMK